MWRPDRPCVVFQIEIEDVKRVYSLFLDQSRSAQFLKDYQDQFMFSEIGEFRLTVRLLWGAAQGARAENRLLGQSTDGLTG